MRIRNKRGKFLVQTVIGFRSVVHKSAFFCFHSKKIRIVACIGKEEHDGKLCSVSTKNRKDIVCVIALTMLINVLN